MKLYNLIVGEGSMWGDGEVTLQSYPNIDKFIDDNELWLPVDGGVFWKRSPFPGFGKKYTANTWPKQVDQEIAECFEYNNVDDQPDNKKLILNAFKKMAKLVQEHGYMIVPYGFEYGMDYLCIHKDDWKVLRNLKIKNDEVVR